MGRLPADERARRTERQNTHVEALRDLFTDAGSTPAGSMKKAPVTVGYLVLFFMSPAARYALGFAQRRRIPPARRYADQV